MILDAPPYVLWLQTGNVNKSAVLGLLLNNAEIIQDSILSGSACIELTG